MAAYSKICRQPENRIGKGCSLLSGPLAVNSGGLCTKSPNPTHGSGWILQIVSTMSHVYEGRKSHQRELVDGSDPFYTESLLRLKFLKERDDHLRSADFLDVEHHPEITFTGNQVEVKGEHDYAVTGDLTIRGVTRKATLNVS
jgi:YceI-like domain